MARAEAKARKPVPWRLVFTAAGWCLVCVSTALAARKVQHFVTTDPQFRLQVESPGAFTLQGVTYASRARIRRVFAEDFGRSIFSMPIAERRRRLLGIDWIEDAMVSRVWPDRIVVSVKERKPVAFVALPAGQGSHMYLVDAHGMLLDPPVRAQFSFPVLSGITDLQSEAERRERVRALMRLVRELGPLARDVSEVNAAEPDNLRVVAQVDGSTVELTLGDGNYERRYRNFLVHYPEIRRRSGEAKAFDLRLDDRITAREQGGS